RKRGLQLDCSLRWSIRELATDSPLPQTQQQLFGRPLVDAVGDRTSVELREQSDELGLLGLGADQQGAYAPVQNGVEVVATELGQHRNERAMRRDARQGVPLETLTGIEEPRRNATRRRRA